MNSENEMATPAQPLALAEYRRKADEWLSAQLPKKSSWHGSGWGVGSDAVPVFNVYDQTSGRALMAAAAESVNRHCSPSPTGS